MNLDSVLPAYVMVQTDTDKRVANPVGETCWEAPDGIVIRREDGVWTLRSPSMPIRRMLLRWKHEFAKDALILNDHYERGYGDLEWRGFSAERILPWYFLVREGETISGYGVQTNPQAICIWQVTDTDISLYLDVRSLGAGVRLGEKKLNMARLISHTGAAGETPFETARAFCKKLCTNGIFPSQPVYGGNNWYYAYGKSSEEEILADTDRIAKWAEGLENRPFMVIDACWQSEIPARPSCTGGPYRHGNAAFPDMAGLAQRIREKGVHPGIWCRPLLTNEAVPQNWVLRHTEEGSILDPTVPQVLEHIGADIRRIAGWGYALIKHDFSTYDVLGRWGFEMGASLTSETRSFHDPSVTTAQALQMLYRTIHDNAGKALIIGCNTMGHLITGYAQIQRTGDDTSGMDWERTRKMGVNTLSHRMAQHGVFFDVDADCVGLTERVPWEMNRQWLDVLSHSATPLFISAEPKALTPAIETAICEAFARAGSRQPVLHPVDWLHNTCPSVWENGQETFQYRWNYADRFVFDDDDVKL